MHLPGGCHQQCFLGEGSTETIRTQAQTTGQRPIVETDIEGRENYRLLVGSGLASTQRNGCGSRFAEEILCGATAGF